MLQAADDFCGDTTLIADEDRAADGGDVGAWQPAKLRHRYASHTRNSACGNRRICSGRREIEKRLGTLMAEHFSIVASNLKASGSEVTWDAPLSADRFEENGANPAQARVRTVLDGNFIQAITFNLSTGSVGKLRGITAAQLRSWPSTLTGLVEHCVLDQARGGLLGATLYGA